MCDNHAKPKIFIQHKVQNLLKSYANFAICISIYLKNARILTIKIKMKKWLWFDWMIVYFPVAFMSNTLSQKSPEDFKKNRGVFQILSDHHTHS